MEIPPRRLEALNAWASGWLSTKIDEDGIRCLKMKARQSDNGTLSRPSRWSILNHIELLADHGRPSVKVTSAHKPTGQGLKVEPDMFMADHDQSSLPDSFFDKMIVEHGDNAYPKMRPEAFHTSGLRWEAYLQAGNYLEMASAWFNQFLMPGMLLYEVIDGRNHIKGLILQSCEHYVVLWELTVLNQEKKVLGLDSGIKPPWKLFHMSCLDTFRVMQLEGLAPMKVKERIGQFRMACTTTGSSMTVLRIAASKGFQGIPLTKLNVLYDYLEMAMVPMPRAEQALVTALVSHLWPEKEEAEVAEMVKRRGKKLEETMPSVLTEDVLQQNQDAIDADDMEEFVRGVARGQRHARQDTEDGEAHLAGQIGGSHGSGAVNRVVAPNPIPWETDDPTGEEAKTYLPQLQACKVTKIRGTFIAG